jgi:hypothetical protein
VHKRAHEKNIFTIEVYLFAEVKIEWIDQDQKSNLPDRYVRGIKREIFDTKNVR